jgi:ABC-type amino acid transport substrate-binding protein
MEWEMKMYRKKRTLFNSTTITCIFAILLTISTKFTFGADLPEIKKRGVLRHLGVPYANFVTGSGDGLDVELIQLFAKHLGVRYEYVPTCWKDVIGDLTGKKVNPKGDDVEVLGNVPVKGDIIANGFTILPWRQKVVKYSAPTFPTQVWLIARADFTIKPIQPTGAIDRDIHAVKALLKGHSILGMAHTCLEPSLYGLDKIGARPISFSGTLNDLVPAVINGDAETCILDVPDTLIALEKWPGRIKVIGPVCPMQEMGCAFAETSPLLLEAFNRFFEKFKKEDAYLDLVGKYYPTVFGYYPDFFDNRVGTYINGIFLD